MPSKSANVRNEKQYEALTDKGMSKERAAKIAHSPDASKHGGKSKKRSDRPGRRQLRRRRRAQGRQGLPLVTAPEVAVLDLDGTLVDSVYVHATAWRAAFREVGLDVPTYRLHRAIGMGGDRLVSAVAGDAAEHAVGDVVRGLHDRLFEARLPEVHELEGASELLEACHDTGCGSCSPARRARHHGEVAVDGGQVAPDRGGGAGVRGAEQAGPRPGGERTGASRFGLRVPDRRCRVGRGVRRPGRHPLRRRC